MSNVEKAAAWLSATPDDRKPHPILPFLQKSYGLTVAQAIAAIRQANLKRGRVT